MQFHMLTLLDVLGILLCGTTLAQFQNQPNTVPQQGFPQQNQPNTVPQQGFPQQNQPNTVPQQGFPQQNQPMNPQQGFPQQPNFPQPNQNSVLAQQPGTNPLLQQPVANNAVPNNRQAPGNQAQQETCAAAGRTAVATCFQTNGGFQMAIVIALLSNGTQGQLPANANQIKDNLCRAQSQIVTCIIQSIASFNGTQQCKSLPAYIRLQQETTGLLTGVQQMCGTSLMPKVTVCMRRLNFDLMNCYNEVGLNPNLFSPSGSRMNGAIIGDNREIARMYCKAKDNLFACQDKVLDNCPRARELQALSGNDQKSMHDGITVLCKDVNVYVSGLVCFQSPTEEVDKCANKLVVDITELTMKQIQQSLPRNLFFREYCKIRIANLVCDSEAWGNKCEKAAVGLKREFQCNLLPAVCKNDTTIMDQYSSACAIPTFDRALRQDGNGAGLLTGSLASVLLGLLSASLFFI